MIRHFQSAISRNHIGGAPSDRQRCLVYDPGSSHSFRKICYGFFLHFFIDDKNKRQKWKFKSQPWENKLPIFLFAWDRHGIPKYPSPEWANYRTLPLECAKNFWLSRGALWTIRGIFAAHSFRSPLFFWEVVSNHDLERRVRKCIHPFCCTFYLVNMKKLFFPR